MISLLDFSIVNSVLTPPNSASPLYASRFRTPESDGSYIIEFMSKSLTVRKPNGNESPSDSSTALAKPTVKTQKSAYTKFILFDLNGNRLGTTNDFTAPANFPKGTYIIRAESNDYSETKKVLR